MCFLFSCSPQTHLNRVIWMHKYEYKSKCKQAQMQIRLQVTSFQAADQLFPGLGATCTNFLFNNGPGIINRFWSSTIFSPQQLGPKISFPLMDKTATHLCAFCVQMLKSIVKHEEDVFFIRLIPFQTIYALLLRNSICGEVRVFWRNFLA